MEAKKTEPRSRPMSDELDLDAATRHAVFEFDREVQDLLLELDDAVAELPDWVKGARR